MVPRPLSGGHRHRLGFVESHRVGPSVGRSYTESLAVVSGGHPVIVESLSVPCHRVSPSESPESRRVCVDSGRVRLSRAGGRRRVNSR